MKHELKQQLYLYFTKKKKRTCEEETLMLSLKNELGCFDIASVMREDLCAKNFDMNVSDDTMERIANKMGNTYIDCGFWEDLVEVAYDLGLIRNE